MSMEKRNRETTVPRVNPVAIAILMIMGPVMLGITIVQGDIWFGVGMLVISWAFAAFLYFGSRFSDTIALISNDAQDERNVHIHQKAALYTLNILSAVIVGAAVVDIARGGTGSPYTWLALVGAATYVGLLVIFSRRG